MEHIYQKFETLLANTSTGFKRYLYKDVAWGSRLIGIIGPRGVGKTTMILQYIKENLDSKEALYVTADDMFFSQNSLYDLAAYFYRSAGQYLFIDEIHKYQDWSKELKNIYDSFPTLKVVFTGSSILDILKGSADLSRRALMYHLRGLSFREYLNLNYDFAIEAFSLDQIVENKVKLADQILHPLPLFKEYLKQGYYPFAIEGSLNIRLSQIIMQTLEIDIPQYASLNVGTSRKLKHLLSIIAESVPFKPNFSKIAEILGVSRNSLDDYFTYLEKTGLIGQLRNDTSGIRSLGKVEKVYLDNTNLIYNLVGEQANIGNFRETFFYNQMKVNHKIASSSVADFVVDHYTFEIGGKTKKHGQIVTAQEAYIVKDDIEYGYQNVIPLWAFGLNY